MPKAHHLAALALLAATATLQGQLTPQQDPANLAGERVSPQDPADTLAISHGIPALQQLLRKLQTRASLMLIVAHPDDEDGGMLTLYSRGQGARVAMLTLNRGEGGQNLMSADFGDALGLIRTQELLAADRYMGVDQLFGTEVDFGFSKTKEEAFAKWGHDRVLYDAVRAVRLYRPLVIASVFIGGPSDGHGQHQVSGEIAQEVFKAAGDPNAFPEMIKEGLLPWQPLKVYARIPFARIDEHGMYDYATNQYVPARFHNYVTGKDTTSVPAANVTIHEGKRDHLLDDKSYIQFARMGLASQKSQIGESFRPAPPGDFDVQYHRYGSLICTQPTPSGCPILSDSGKGGISSALVDAEAAPEFTGTEASFFDGIDTSIASIASLAPDAPPTLRAALDVLGKELADAQQFFVPSRTDLVLPHLKNALSSVDSLITLLNTANLPKAQGASVLHELMIKRVQLNQAIVLALGLTLEAHLSPTSKLIPVQNFEVDFTLANNGPAPVDITSSNLTFTGGPLFSPAMEPLKPLTEPLTVDPNRSLVDAFQAVLPRTAPLTRPYFSRTDIEQPVYTLSSSALRNSPGTPAPLVVSTVIDLDGTPIELATKVSVAPLQPASVVPCLSASVAPRFGILPPAGGKTTIDVTAHVLCGDASITLNVPNGWKTESPIPYLNMVPGPTHDIPARFTITTPALPADTVTSVTARLTGMFNDPSEEGFRPVGYPGLTYTNYYTPATFRATVADVRIAPNLRVAYLQGTGDNVPAYLPNLGVTPTILTVADLTQAKLSQFDTVILGVRAYAAHPELAGPGSKPLLDFAAAGGTVIVQYNNGRYGTSEAPYPITTAVSSTDHAHDVIDESQPVAILKRDATLLNFPNHITPADFDHWVEERGHGFAGTWGPEFTALVETHDPGQEPQNGGLLVARVGKGFYVYCGLALYRQLPEGVPGAYRLFANLLSLPKAPK